MHNDQSAEGATTRTLGPAAETAGTTTAYLLVVDGDRSFRYPLPPTGVLLVGRGSEADLSLND
jgi:hypothetical protein